MVFRANTFAERASRITKWSSRRTARRRDFRLRGKLLQSGVPDYFIAPVPIYASTGLGHTVFLGTVTATGEQKHPSPLLPPIEPHKLLIDPHMTLLCIPE